MQAEPDEDTGKPSGARPSATGIQGFAFLLVVLLAVVLGTLLLARPLATALATMLTSLGVPNLDPAIAGGGIGLARSARRLPEPFLVFLGVTQFLMLVAALVGGALLGGGLRHRIGLIRPRGGWRVLGLAAVLDVLALGFGVCAVAAVIPPGLPEPVPQVERMGMILQAPLPWWIAIVLAMSILPGLCEEALFRGLIQRRLLELWSPAAAIAATAIVFAVLHPPPARGLALLPGCLWLGYVTWRCDSILPAIVLHAGSNLGFQALLRSIATTETSADPDAASRWALGGAAILIGAIGAWLLVVVHRWTRPSSVTPPDPGLPIA